MGISDDIKPKKTFHLSKEAKRESVHPEKILHEKVEVETEDRVEVETEDEEIGSIPKSQLEDDFFSGFHKPKHRDGAATQNSPKKHSCFGRTITVVIILALIGIVAYQNKKVLWEFVSPSSENKNADTAEEIEDYYVGEKTVTANPAAEPPATVANPPASSTATTSEPVIDKAGISIEVLNGNGINGSADKVGDQLIAAGFKVAKITNALKFTYTGSYIYYKTGKEAEANLVKTALSDRNCTLELSDTIVKSYDVVVVVGKN